MSKKKVFTLTALVMVALTLAFFTFRFFNHRSYTSRLPEILEGNTLSEAVHKQIEEADKAARKRPAADNLGHLGMVYHSSAFYSQAEQCYTLASERDKKDWRWDYYKGYLNLELGNPEKVIGNFEKVIAKKPGSKLPWFYIGGEYKNLGNMEKALESYKKLINPEKTIVESNATRNDHFPISVYAQYELARIYFDEGQVDEAEKLLESIIQNYYLFGPAYRLLGSVYQKRGDEQMAKKYTIRANDLILYSPPVDSLIDKLVLISRSDQFLLKKIDEAERSVYPEWTLKLVEHGMQYLPDNRYMVSKAIKTYLWLMQPEKAKALTDRHMQLFNDNFPEISRTGLAFFRKEMFQEAIKYWTFALKIKPGDIETRQNLAKCYMATGDRGKAQELLEEIYHQNSGKSGIAAQTVYQMYNFGEKQKAVQYLQQVKRIAPGNPDVLKLEADMAKENGNVQTAISKYEASLKKDPTDQPTIKKLGALLFSRKEWKKYESLYRRSLEIYPNDPELLERLGTYLINCPDTVYKNIAEGKEYVERAFTFYDCPPDVLLSSGMHLSYAYAMLGDKQRAVTTISQTINLARKMNVSETRKKQLESFLAAFKSM